MSKLLHRLGTYPTRRYKKGNIVIYQGEVPQGTYVVRSGAIKVYSINMQGDERTVVFYTEGDIFPALVWRSGLPIVASYYYEAIQDTELICISGSELKQMLDQDKDLLSSLVEYYSDHYVQSMMRINALEQAKASEKVVHTLHYLIYAYGDEIHDGLYKIKVNLTQNMLASLIGLTRETTANELLRLKRAGVLSYRSQRYMVQRDKLLALIGEENFRL
jgi:CRP/FNR family transcriptional regulator, cyclic AMP receptor protein